MRLETITRELYAFDELTDEAQAVAIQENFDINLDYYWDLFPTQECAEAAATLGISEFCIEEYDLDHNTIAICGSYQFSAPAVSASAGYGLTLEEIAQALAEAAQANGGNLNATMSRSDAGGTTILGDAAARPAMEQFARWCLREMRDTYEHLTSQQAIEETLRGSDYEQFTVDGHMTD